jgi:nucleoside-diphosphate-sugar epimerase
MRVVIAGGHGKIALLLGKALVERDDAAVGIVRNPDHVGELAELGIEAAVVDLERSSVNEVAGVLAGADAAVFAAGAGPGSGADRKDTVDRAAAILFADATAAAGIRRFVLVSSMGVESVRDGATPSGVDDVFAAYLRAKLAAEDDVLARDDLDATVLRPGGLTDEPGVGRVWLAPKVDRGSIPRADVAAVLVALLDRRPAAPVLELVAGDTPVTEAV